ncbi:unnamed protein product [Heligmosomoides polygyrus]|uniref:Reverse transcriptase domain-containing protein n=1 Tax=Heligmosomoides polygyrus TaxID=6339 RepID=A0A183FN07_HELPZ|nr:unnamed protein product [Heligmosomoides polygyrus]
MPDDWRNSTIVPIFKQKGDASECSNYRGIKLISHTMKIYERLVDSRLRVMVPFSQVQWGSMPERSTTDAIFIDRQVMEKYREKRRPCYLAFLDLEKAYGRLPGPYSGKPFEGDVSKDEGPLRTILYADDIALVADNQEELEEKVQLWQTALADNGLRLNVKKTRFVSSEQCAGSILDCQGEAIEKVEDFRYLGSDLFEEGRVDQPIRGRINAA